MGPPPPGFQGSESIFFSFSKFCLAGINVSLHV
jgi:hypothetical protein